VKQIIIGAKNHLKAKLKLTSEEENDEAKRRA